LGQCCHYLFKIQLNLQRGVTSAEYLYILTTNGVRSLGNISSFIIVKEMPCVYYEVGIGCLYFICAKFIIPVVSASRMFVEMFGLYFIFAKFIVPVLSANRIFIEMFGSCLKEVPSDVSQRFPPL
jgi:hypothetical protein